MHVSDRQLSRYQDVVTQEIFSVLPFNCADVAFIDSNSLSIVLTPDVQSAIPTGAGTYLLVTTIAASESLAEFQSSGNVASYNPSALDELYSQSAVVATPAGTYLPSSSTFWDVRQWSGIQIKARCSSTQMLSVTVEHSDDGVSVVYTQAIGFINESTISLPKTSRYMRLVLQGRDVTGFVNVSATVIVRRLIGQTKFERSDTGSFFISMSLAANTVYQIQLPVHAGKNCYRILAQNSNSGFSRLTFGFLSVQSCVIAVNGIALFYTLYSTEIVNTGVIDIPADTAVRALDIRMTSENFRT